MISNHTLTWLGDQPTIELPHRGSFCGLLLSRGHTTNKCWPTCVCQQCWQTKVCRVFKKLANILCWTTMLAVYELVRFLLANTAANRVL